MNATRHPLSWPAGWKRTDRHARRRAEFSKSIKTTWRDGTVRNGTRSLTVAEALTRLGGELSRLGATDELLSSNLAVRLDGLPRSGEAEPSDPGAAVYFKLKGKDRCLACDRWDRVADNIAAIAQHIDALRRIDRYGVGTMEQAFAGYAALPPTHEDWWLVLGVSPRADAATVKEAYRTLLMTHHLHRGGDPEVMAKINRAYQTFEATQA